jgi:hypothetical protein
MRWRRRSNQFPAAFTDVGLAPVEGTPRNITATVEATIGQRSVGTEGTDDRAAIVDGSLTLTKLGAPVPVKISAARLCPGARHQRAAERELVFHAVIEELVIGHFAAVNFRREVLAKPAQHQQLSAVRRDVKIGFDTAM